MGVTVQALLMVAIVSFCGVIFLVHLYPLQGATPAQQPWSAQEEAVRDELFDVPPLPTRPRLSATQELAKAEKELAELTHVLEFVEGEVLAKTEAVSRYGATFGKVSRRPESAAASWRPAAIREACEKDWVTKVVVWSCDRLAHSGGANSNPHFIAAMTSLCTDGKVNKDLLTIRLDCAFASNYLRMYGSDGETKRAVIVDVSPDPHKRGATRITREGIRNLANSMNQHTRAALVAFTVDPKETSADADTEPSAFKAALLAEEFPRLVHFHLIEESVTVHNKSMSRSFAMVRMILLSRANCVIVLSAYSIVGERIDTLFGRAAVHTNPEYPFPIVPKYNMAHEHPTATVHALPFLADIYAAAVAGGITYANDDWLSMPKFSRMLVKSWCKWDFKLGREPHRIHYMGYMCDCSLEYAEYPGTVLQEEQRRELWTQADCSGTNGWLGFRGLRYYRRLDFLSKAPGCVA